MTDTRSGQTDPSADSPIGDHGRALDMTVVSSTPLMPESGPQGSSFAELAKLLEGQHLDHFQLLESIGGGGMGVVFRAVDTQLGRTVAVKVLSRYEAGDEDALVRFQNEAQSAARLDHVNIARVYFVGEDKGWHYIVFEYIDGINVRDLVERDGPLSIADAVSFTLQTAEALGHASRRDVVHRDIKPSNVLITDERRAKLVDMGLARLHQVEHSNDDLTASGVTLGTFDYISPEQARDPCAADVRSDVYSLGCTLFFMLAGRPPFPEGTVLQKLLKHQSEAPPPLQQLRPDAPAELLAIADRMLAKKPDDRYQDAGSLVSEFYALAEKLGVRTGSSSGLAIVQRPAPPSAWARHLPWLLPVATLAFAVVLLEVFWSARAASSSPPPISGALRASGPAATEFDPMAASQTSDDATPGEGTNRAGAGAPSDLKDDTSRRVGPINDGGSPGKSPKKTSPPTKSDNTPANAKDKPNDKAAGDDSSTEKDGRGESPDNSHTAPNGDEPVVGEKPLVGAARNGRLLIVGDGEMYAGESHYATLRAACLAAKSGDAIELRYDGARIERPIRFKQQPLLTIRAGRRTDGQRYRPQIVFKPHESDLDEYGSGMLVLDAGASLRLVGAHLILDPGEVAAQQWSLVSLVGAKSFRASNCWLTIRNAADNNQAYHRDVAFFHARRDAKQGVIKMVDPSIKETPVSIALSDCVVRGESRVLQIDDLALVDFQWNNGLCATTEPLLFARGGKTELPQSSTASHVALTHVTAVLGGGLCSVSSRKNAPYQRPMNVQCAGSIFVGDANTSLMTQTGLASVDEIRDGLRYSGERLFYQGIRHFWRVDSRQADETDRSDFDFTEWRAHWKENELYPQLNQVVWRHRPALTQPAHQRVPAEFLLEDSDFNPARGGGEGGSSDGKDAGMLRESISDFAIDESMSGESGPMVRADGDESTEP